MREVVISSIRHSGCYLSKTFPIFDEAVQTQCLPIAHFCSSPVFRQHNVSIISHKTLSTIPALQHGPTLCVTAITALWGFCWVSVAAAGQAAAFLQEELHAGWTDCAVERTRSLALSAWAVASLTLGFVLLQTQNTRSAPLILHGLDLTWQLCHVIQHCGCHLWS